MRVNDFKTNFTKAVLLLTVLLLGAHFAASQVSLTAGPATATMPDGSAVPMWGYTCTAQTAPVTCSALNPATAAVPGSWSPIIITVPYTGTGTSLTINLTNNLSFTPTGGGSANNIPTSIVIIGQVGGGLGQVGGGCTGGATCANSPDHSQAQANVTWPIAVSPAPTPGTPPVQGKRVQSLATEALPGAASATVLTWSNLKPGTYLLESGTHPSIQVPMGLVGMLVVTTAPTSNAGANGTTETGVGTAYPATANNAAVTYDAEVPALFSEIDPNQNNSVSAAVNTNGFNELMVWSGQPGGCGNPSSATYHQCYPPAVNYSPLYYLINGVAFNKTASQTSLFASAPSNTSSTVTGFANSVLVRMVNAGLRMHVPSIVGSQTIGFDGAGTNTNGAPTSTVSGFALIAEDGNVIPGNHKVQSDVFMAAGKTYDVMINVPATGTSALPIFDRQLSLSGNSSERDAGMLAYLSVNGASLPASAAFAPAVARADTYNSLVAGQTLNVSDVSKGVIANDTNVYGVQLVTQATNGFVVLNANGTFTYTPNAGSNATNDSFGYCGNGAPSGTTGLCTTVTLGGATIEGASGISCAAPSYTANTGTYLAIKTPGVLAGCKDAMGYPLTVIVGSVAPASGLTVLATAGGAFTATTSTAGQYTFTFKVQNSQGTPIANAVTATITFPQANGPKITVLDGKDKSTVVGDYRWIIEEDKTFYVNPNCTTNTGSGPPAAGCPALVSGGTVPTFGVNFHTSHMEFVAQGCTGPLSCESGQTLLGVAAACDLGDGNCRTTAAQKTAVDPSQVALDPTRRYYISVLPGDAANAFNSGNTTSSCSIYTTSANQNASTCGHGMGGAPIIASCFAAGSCTSASSFSPVTILVQPNPYPTGKLSVMVFEDDFPLNGEQDNGGGIDAISPNEPGLGGFEIVMWDDMGASGDVTGQMTYDMFNQPLSNSLAGTIDPATGLDACPISPQITADTLANGNLPTGQTGVTGMIVTCPKYESDGATLSPLAGQAVVANLMPGRFSVQAYPAADRIARGEEWLQTNTLDGQHAHDSFIRIGEPAYFQEYGPAGYHVSIGFANPSIINARHDPVCAGAYTNGTPIKCQNTIDGNVTGIRMSRTPDERLYESGSRDTFFWTQCFVSLGDPDAEDFMFTKCDANGHFSFTGVPDGEWRLTLFDQWNDQLVDGLSTPANVSGGQTLHMGNVGAQQWQSNVYTKTFIDDNRDGIYQSNELGIPLLNTTVRYRDGSLANNLLTDFTGTANFNETFPLFNWYTVEADVTRYKTTGIHTVYDAGGPANGSTYCGTGTNGNAPCAPSGTDTAFNFLANTYERSPLPSDLSVPGAVYCPSGDCSGQSIANGPTPSQTTNHSTGRIDPPWVAVEGWQGFSGQNNFIEFGKAPYATGENGGIHGHVIYASTRPFDDPQLLVQTQWEPLVPHVTINLYKEGFAADGVTPTLTLVDTTQTSSFDDWAQGFYPGTNRPYMSCPGQMPAPTSTTPGDLFFFTLYNQPDYLDVYNNQHNGTPLHTIPYNSQYKCYDGMHNWNQVQPAPYDGMYSFPSVIGIDPNTGKPTGTNCTGCTTNPDSTDPYRFGLPMLPAGKYVVEVVLPPGYELVKEEDKNILIGDNFIAPVTQEFGGLGDIFIMPDQASVASAYDPTGSGYNAYNGQNPTQSLGAGQQSQIVPGFVEPVWPCVGETHVVPDYISLFPQSQEVAPFAGATRNLCDRKEVTLGNQMGATAKFYIFTSTHIAAKFAGGITDDFTSEFDPFAPQFGEKFAPPDMPISVRDWSGAETNRIYSDHFGQFNGITYSTWEVNPPNPTGYSPTMMVTCMNDAGPIPDPNHAGQFIADPLFNPNYSQFCYELPFMPGTTDYLDTPVVPTAAFAGGYNFPDCQYPDTTPAIASVVSDQIAGPWVPNDGLPHTLTITSLGDQNVANPGYSGPSASTAPFNMKTIKRHYGFGGTTGTVTIGGVSATVTNWGEGSITVNVPAGVPACAVQQQAQYGGPNGTTVPKELCGQLVVTNSSGVSSIDAVTVTIGGKQPTLLTPPPTNGTIPVPGVIQSAINSAKPGDLLIIPPGNYWEMVIMWKPVRLQGVGAASVVINANSQPAGLLLEPWRQNINCLFGLTLMGVPIGSKGNSGTQAPAVYDPTGAASCPATGWNNFVGTGNNPQVDRLPLEAVVGWDASLNGNIAELLQEPSLMGAYEGAGITVLAKGVNFHGANPWTDGSEPGGFPAQTTLLTQRDCASGPRGANPNPSNFQCNPSSIDGLSITDSSQGGGGIFVHGWAHNLQIANNRVYNNAGTLSGGISVGQGEFAPANIAGSTTNSPPGSCQQFGFPGQELPYCLDMNVNVHNNAITQNSSLGDELFSSTLAGGGGATFCTGADYYKFNYNWVCGNISSGEGGGLVHLGFIYNGDIEHNTIIFNQSTNPTVPTNGGGIMVQGTPDTDPVCGVQPDQDCPPGLSDGTGPGLVINANLIQGNSADSGSGGGVRLQSVNGTEVSAFPTRPNQWYSVNLTNNIIVNNVAGWDGAGISLQDALAVNITNNTIAHNDSVATSGVLNNTLGAVDASAPSGNCTQSGGTVSCPQASGLVTMANTSLLTTSLTGLTINCPNGHPHCAAFSNPSLQNNILWQNRAFDIGVGTLGSAAQNQNQQNVVTLYEAFTTTAAPNQGSTGDCSGGASYWDIGVRGDTGPGNHSSGLTLAPTYSVITDAGDYSGGNNLGSNPAATHEYCNGSRVPPECTVANGCISGAGWAVPPGIADAVVPNPVFGLQPAATVDEGNNWINLTWGPLSQTNPAVQGADGNYGGGSPLANYNLTSASPAIDYVPVNQNHPARDFYGNPRPDPAVPNRFDIGAIEFQGVVPAPTLASITPTSGTRGTVVNVTLTGTNLLGTTSIGLAGGGGITVSNINVVSSTSVTATFTIAANAGIGPRQVSITTPGGTATPAGVTFTVTGLVLNSITPGSSNRGTAVNVTLAGSGLTGASAINVSGTGITVSNIAVNAAGTQVTATFTIAANATLGPRAVSVTTPLGTTNPVPFRVTRATVFFFTSGLTTGVPNRNVKNGTVTVFVGGGPLTLNAAPTLGAPNTGTGSFSIAAGGTCVSGLVINPGGNCTINVTYTPPAAGSPTSSTTLTLSDSGADTAQQTDTVTGN